MTLKLNGTNSVAAPAYAGDDADTGLQCGTNELKLVTGGSARATVDSSGRLLVGATSGTGKFIVQDSSLPKIQANYAGSKHLEFGVGGSGCGFAMTTGHFMTFNHQPYSDRGTDNNLTERVRILSSGGITFNGDTADANALDDYEEGEWTPAAQHYDGTLTVVSADYVKVGQLVHVNMYVSFSNTTDGSDINITGLPYTVAGDANNHYSLFTAHTNGNLPNFHLRPQGTTNQMLGVYLASGDGDRKPSYTNLANKFIIMGGTYRATP